MVKKLVCLLAVCLLLIPCAALAETRVFDEANLFTAAEIQEMEAYIEQIRTDYQVDVAVATSDSVPMNRSQAYSDDFYASHDFGMGEDHAGLLFLIDMSNRVPVITTDGVMIDYITDSRLENLLDAGYNDLRMGRYGSASMRTLKQLGAFLREGRQKGSFRYDLETGKRLSGLYNPLTSGEMLVAALAGLAVAAIFVASVSARYQLKGSTYRYNLADNASRSLTREDEQFIRQFVTRQARQPVTTSHTGSGSGGSRSSGMGSAVHRSSSGRSFGGGTGRKF